MPAPSKTSHEKKAALDLAKQTLGEPEKGDSASERPLTKREKQAQERAEALKVKAANLALWEAISKIKYEAAVAAKEIDAALAAGARVDAKNPRGRSSLEMAVEAKHPRTLKKLLPLGDVWVSGTRGVSLLTMAESKSFELGANLIVQAMLDDVGKGGKFEGQISRLDALDVAGFAPLHVAVKMKSASMCKDLLWAGVDPNKKRADGMTALMMAAEDSEPTLFAMLLPKSDTAAVDDQRRTAIFHAAEIGFELGVKALLPMPGADAVDAEGLTPLMVAARNSEAEMTILLAKSSNVWAENEDGRTPLMLACENGTDVMEPAIDALIGAMRSTASDVKMLEHLSVARGIAMSSYEEDAAEKLRVLSRSIAERIELMAQPEPENVSGARGNKARL